MHSTSKNPSIATTSPSCVSEAERSYRITIRTPQRKIDKNDKTRVRLKVIKAIALRDCKCRDSAEMKRRLRKIGVLLDLRLTAAWVAIVEELQWLLRGEDYPLAASIKPQQQIEKPVLRREMGGRIILPPHSLTSSANLASDIRIRYRCNELLSGEVRFFTANLRYRPI